MDKPSAYPLVLIFAVIDDLLGDRIVCEARNRVTDRLDTEGFTLRNVSIARLKNGHDGVHVLSSIGTVTDCENRDHRLHKIEAALLPNQSASACDVGENLIEVDRDHLGFVRQRGRVWKGTKIKISRKV